MEARQNARTVPTRPIVLVMAILSVMALALTGWYVLGAGVPTPAATRTITTSSQGPDAQERNANLQKARDIQVPEDTHGH